MKNRIDILFEKKGKKIISLFFTAGFPSLNATNEVIKAIENSEADMMEIGIPFSDPLADGLTIQKCSAEAIKNGMNLEYLMNELTSLRKKCTKPVLLMGYLNSVLQYGTKRFYEDCKKCGIDGVILPDLPLEEYEKEHKELAMECQVHVIFLITPKTKPERLSKINSLSHGFIYLVSSNSTTGNNAERKNELEYFTKSNAEKRIKKPILVGFGIYNRSTFINACKYGNGVIIGSEYLRRIAEAKDIEVATKEFINELKQKTYDNTVAE